MLKELYRRITRRWAVVAEIMPSNPVKQVKVVEYHLTQFTAQRACDHYRSLSFEWKGIVDHTLVQYRIRKVADLRRPLPNEFD